MNKCTRRALVIEDDASMQRLIKMAVEDDPVDITICSSVAEAVVLLEQTAFDLVVSDLMLPGESGSSLIHRMFTQPALRKQAELVVLSAGITQQQRAELKELGVNGFLLKPVSMARLRQLLLNGLREPEASAAQGSHPVTAYFEGNQALFDQFAAHCAIQFEMDCRHGDDADKRQDMSGLYTVAHTLSAALEMLGEKNMVDQCRSLMYLTKKPGHVTQASVAWKSLGQNLQALSKRLRLKSLQ